MDKVESEFLHHEECPECGSKDNLGRYSDGHGHCFGCGFYVKGDGTVTAPTMNLSKGKADLLSGEYRALAKRNITEETCRKYGYKIGEFKNKAAQIATYHKDGFPVGQKVRLPGKEFLTIGDMKNTDLFGQHLFGSGKKIVICEGEIDTLTVSQVGNNKWPTVGIPLGSKAAAKSVAHNLKYFSNFQEVIIMFDMDEAGQSAALEVAKIFPSGKAKIASLPMKDANECLQAGRGSDIVSAIWDATPYTPEGIVKLSDVKDSVLNKVEQGLPWFLPTLNNMTFGRRFGEVYAVGAGTGVGKTDLLTQQIKHDIIDLNMKVGAFFLEQQPSETVKRVAGKHAGKKFHVPDGAWTTDELTSAIDDMDNDNLYMFDHFGLADWDTIEESIRYLYHADGVQIFYIDHLTALATGEGNEREELERIMAEMGSIVKELNIMLVIISHLATPEQGKSHEEGGRVTIRHFKGSRAIGFWCHFMFGLERDQQSENVSTRHTTTLRVLKDRLTGQSVGECIYLGYAPDTGLLYETEKPVKDGPSFKDHTQEDPVGNNDF